jgi:hypothetical protein
MTGATPTAARRPLDEFLAEVRGRVSAAAALRGVRVGAIAGLFLLPAVSLMASTTVGLPVALLAPGAAAAISWARARRRPDGWLGQLVEARSDRFRNSVITALELRAHPDRASAAMTDRVTRDAEAACADARLDALVPIRRRAAAAVLSMTALIAASLVLAIRPALVDGARARVTARTGTGGAVPSGRLSIVATVTPPAYAKVPVRTLDNPATIESLEGSAIALSIRSSSATLRLRTGAGETRTLERDAGGTFHASLPIRTGYVALEGERPSERQLISLVATPDLPPRVRLLAPGRDLIYPDAARTVTFDIAAQDDLELRALRLHYTRVSGSGENFEFTEGDLPIDVTRRDARTWEARASTPLARLPLEPGDTLVYQASASDARPGIGSSDTFVIEIGKAAEGLAEGFAIAEDENKYAISQQMVIVKTERLHARRASMAADAVATESMNIAAEQRLVRAEFVFMMGGEVEDEEVEAEQSNELQEGRLENRGQSDLRTAIRLMSDAEHRLIAQNTGAALPVERAALAALERAFSRNRYILRTLAAQSRIELSRRLSGDRSRAASWVRPGAAAMPRMNVPHVAALLAEIAMLAAAPAWTAETAGHAARLAERTLALDVPSAAGGAPAGAALRTASRQMLQAAARAPGSRGLDAARTDLQAAATALLPLARDAAAPAVPNAPPVGPAVRGAFADALRRGRPR